MVMRKIYALLIVASFLGLSACDKKPADKSSANANEPAVETEVPGAAAEPDAEPEPEPEPELTEAQIAARETPFGDFVDGADLVKVGRSHFETGSTKESGVTKDADVIASLIASIGVEKMSEPPKSDCQPKYYVVFFKGEDKLKSFKLWCDKGDSVPALYLEDRQFTPTDVKTAGKMIKGILDGTYAEKPTE